MNKKIKKVIRTLQSELPFLKDAKDSFYLYARRLSFITHDRDFNALRSIPPQPEGSLYVDVGANQGQSIESILKVRPEAT